MAEVNIKIGGREFHVVCQEGQESFLHSAAAMLDTEASKLDQSGMRVTESRMLLMAGLMLADRTAALEDQAKELDPAEITTMIETQTQKAEQAQAKLGQAHQEIVVLRQQQLNLQSQLQQSQSVTAPADNSGLEAELSDTKDQLEQSQERIALMKRELLEMEGAQSEGSENNQSTSLADAQKMDALSDQLDNANQQVDALQTKVADLQDDEGSQKQSVTQAHAMLDQSVRDVDMLKAEMADMQSQLDTSEMQGHADINAQLAASRAEVAQLSAELNEMGEQERAQESDLALPEMADDEPPEDLVAANVLANAQRQEALSQRDDARDVLRRVVEQLEEAAG